MTQKCKTRQVLMDISNKHAVTVFRALETTRLHNNHNTTIWVLIMQTPVSPAQLDLNSTAAIWLRQYTNDFFLISHNIAIYPKHSAISNRVWQSLLMGGRWDIHWYISNWHIEDGWRRFAFINTSLFSLHNTLNYAIHRACLRMVLLTDVYRNLTSLWINF